MFHHNHALSSCSIIIIIITINMSHHHVLSSSIIIIIIIALINYVITMINIILYCVIIYISTIFLSSIIQQYHTYIHIISYLVICRTLKDVKRRATQSVLATVGAAESTKDEDFDAHMEHFTSMLQDMNECKLLVKLMMYACMYMYVCMCV